MLQNVEKVVRQAAQLMLTQDDIVNHRKEGHANFVTETDMAVQEQLRTALSSVLPGSSFFAEEQVNNPLTDAPTWVVDPIDGTTNFIRGRNSSAISVALLENKVPVLAVVYNPYADEMFTARIGQGAYMNGAPIRVSDVPFSNALVLMGTTPYSDAYAAATFRAAYAYRLEAADLRRSGSAAIDLCDVACGRAEIFYEMSLSPWDVAAGALLITEAGGTFDMPGLHQPDFSAPHGMLATNGLCREDAMRIFISAMEEKTI
ncbi:MAG: inositol monophosphatase family protein [Christensenellales bacterium]|jgi:myo-inositol-1(or 4)-monophosphatase